MTIPAIGAIGSVHIKGSNWRSKLPGELIVWGTGSRYNHSVMYVGDYLLAEARPGGASCAAWDIYNDISWTNPGDFGFIDETGTRVPMPVSDEQGQRAATAMLTFATDKIGYGYQKLIAIGLAQRKFNIVDLTKPLDQQPWWVRELERGDKLFCSQAVDLAYAMVGEHFFNDGRIPGFVSPGDLARIANV